jgi:peptide/nickel transport system permease protein
VPLGLWAGLRRNGLAGRAIMGFSILGFSLPTFWVGLMLIMLFSVQLGWLPSSGRGETVEVLGIPLSFLTLDGLRIWCCRR